MALSPGPRAAVLNLLVALFRCPGTKKAGGGTTLRPASTASLNTTHAPSSHGGMT